MDSQVPGSDLLLLLRPGAWEAGFRGAGEARGEGQCTGCPSRMAGGCTNRGSSRAPAAQAQAPPAGQSSNPMGAASNRPLGLPSAPLSTVQRNRLTVQLEEVEGQLREARQVRRRRARQPYTVRCAPRPRAAHHSGLHWPPVENACRRCATLGSAACPSAACCTPTTPSLLCATHPPNATTMVPTGAQGVGAGPARERGHRAAQGAVQRP